MRTNLILTGTFVFGLLWLLPSTAEARTIYVDCGRRSLQVAIDRAEPGDTIQVTNGSTCNENVVIGESKRTIVIDGLGSAVINGPDPGRATIHIRGAGITLTGFTITGGADGVGILRGGTALIAGNAIQNTGRDGVTVSQGSVARFTNNTIQNVPGKGIDVSENSSARIGFLTIEGLERIHGSVGPNTIRNNGESGVHVHRSSSARVVGNVISNNGRHGIEVLRVSYASVASNAIDGNTADGISVSQNSGVELRDTIDPNDSPNSTAAVNGGVGIRCAINSYADGRLGTLNGASGATGFAGSCVNSLVP